MTGAQTRLLAPNRLHLHHGPIDCIVEAEGDDLEIIAAFAAASDQFETILNGLVSELPILRSPLSGKSAPQVLGKTAQRMVRACWPLRAQFITPMAAVAGAVADTLLWHIIAAAPNLKRVWVNDGGDIAFHLSTATSVTFGLVDDPQRPTLFGNATIHAIDAPRGIATSGWRGRSHSLGIADAVTVLAASAAQADAAATLIANAVNCTHPQIERIAACALQPDSDLGARLVTVNVPHLDASEIDAALAAGVAFATELYTCGAVFGVVLQLQGATCIVPAHHPCLKIAAPAVHGLAQPTLKKT